ncbi:hypothetical protein EJ03DRAFT_16741 [Teratosphaeria nubilosa]|uniref:Uncharacterized protein n=1 Tax=Teratosphaeria nubilosa TaxID=161662 RepID=A0A6G1KVN7_9PEZI|nr:hypothetical protein EJ03DRAFT_16741 [Teratosphaeria nubilosa]
MIDQQTGLQAYVAKYDEDNEFSTKYYYEYIAPPESPFFSPNANVRYIEAVDGERYELVLIIPSSYYFGTNTHVQVIYQVNGKTYLVDQLARPKAPAQLESRFSTTFLEVGGIMQRAGLKFPELRGRSKLVEGKPDTDDLTRCSRERHFSKSHRAGETCRMWKNRH